MLIFAGYRILGWNYPSHIWKCCTIIFLHLFIQYAGHLVFSIILETHEHVCEFFISSSLFLSSKTLTKSKIDRLVGWFFFGHAPHHGMWDLSFLTRDWTCTPYSGSMKSLPPDFQESHSPRPLTIQVLDLLDYLIFSSIFYRINLYKVQKNMQVKRFLHLHSRYKT